MPVSLNLKVPLAISGAAILFSLLFSFAVFPLLESPLRLNIDPDGFGELGANIYNGKGYVASNDSSPAISRGPVYPYVLAGLFLLSGGVNLSAVQIFQAICHGLTTFLIFLLGARLFHRRVAILGQTLCSVHPLLIWYTARIWVETVFTLAVVVVLFAVILLVERATASRSVAAGVAMGIATLTKSILLLFPFLVGFFLIAYRKKEGRRPAVVLMLSFLMVVAPWTLRNYRATGQFVPVHTLLGVNMIQGDAIGECWTKHPLSSLELWHHSVHEIDSLLFKSGYSPTDPEGDRILFLSSLKHNFSSPLEFIKRDLINFLTFWYLGESPLKSMLLASIQLPLLVCVIAVILRLWQKNMAIRVVVLLIAYFAVAHSLVNGWARFSTPIVPASLLFVSYAIMEVRQKLKAKLMVRALEPSKSRRIFGHK
jgi:4-amino-4-deoxy-L-arabinose transferase-like glycosyltransferase